jgi:hypothetical protein
VSSDCGHSQAGARFVCAHNVCVHSPEWLCHGTSFRNSRRTGAFVPRLAFTLHEFCLYLGQCIGRLFAGLKPGAYRWLQEGFWK